jgi:hypothetical protein
MYKPVEKDGSRCVFKMNNVDNFERWEFEVGFAHEIHRFRRRFEQVIRGLLCKI